jgi:hypothetical protein
VAYEGVLEWGFAPNHEIGLSLPVFMGDGAVEGNADANLIWQWRLWKEDTCGWLPAFAFRNIVRIPNGYGSEGVDWTLQGLMSKWIIQDKLRLHVNPFLQSLNGDNLEDEARQGDDEGRPGAFSSSLVSFQPRGAGLPHQRHFRWGIIAGASYNISECLTLSADYIHESSYFKGARNQHLSEIELDWKLSECQTIAFLTRVGLDGDSVGENWGATVSYIHAFDVASINDCKLFQ